MFQRHKFYSASLQYYIVSIFLLHKNLGEILEILMFGLHEPSASLSLDETTTGHLITILLQLGLVLIKMFYHILTIFSARCCLQ